ncbi:hypothetical protein [Actinomadura roseirufa]|uniref:hypothetical protein n=1 Tax=Actinomadura roseirufa TaxID=2094049 RepID=UPI0010411F76|nr:hypothetical protein [Actinomadura roseirufa]
MTEERIAAPGDDAGEHTKGRSTGDGLGSFWVVPALLLLAARGVRALGDGGVWNGVAIGLAGLAAVITVAELVTAVRRRAYTTLATLSATVLLAGTFIYLKSDLF